MSTTLAPSASPPRPSRLDDRAYLDFVQGARLHALTSLHAAAERTAEQALARHGGAIGTFGELRGALDEVPIVAMRERVMRSQQEMTWRMVRRGLTASRGEDGLLEELGAADAAGPGLLVLDPALELPEWFTAHEIHIQPGGYFADPIGGYVYHHVIAMRQFGKDDDNAFRQSQIDLVPLPEDRRVAAVLDLGSAVGSSAIALKQRFADARVVGVDLSAPLLRYAHRRASSLGVELELYQRPADRVGFEDGTFDLVNAYILFHEVPRDVAAAVVREAWRVLRPGGVFAVQDFASRPAGGPFGYGDYTRSCDSEYNGEPFADGFAYGGFEELLEDVFGNVAEVPGTPAALQMRACRR